MGASVLVGLRCLLANGSEGGAPRGPTSQPQRISTKPQRPEARASAGEGATAGAGIHQQRKSDDSDLRKGGTKGAPPYRPEGARDSSSSSSSVRSVRARAAHPPTQQLWKPRAKTSGAAAEEDQQQQQQPQREDTCAAVHATAAAYKAKSQTKVVVRHLPPAVVEAELLQTLPANLAEAVTFSCLISGRPVGLEGELSPSAWFLNLKTPQDAEALCRLYHGRVFMAADSTLFRAVCCLAPYQKTPRLNKTTDRKDGTIFQDKAYLAFVASLEQHEAESPSPPQPIEKTDTLPAPLVDGLLLLLRLLLLQLLLRLLRFAAASCAGV
ncbi:hypothetical protein Esti_004516 [Eimeria stiedai]